MLREFGARAIPKHGADMRYGILVAAATAMGTSAAHAVTTESFGTFDIVLNFTSSVTASQEQAFLDAEAFWESRITGYRTQALADSVNSNGPFGDPAGLDIDASIIEIDGSGGTLGRAGSTGQATDGTEGSGFMVSTSGLMEFDDADVADLETQGTFIDVVMHEMAHVIGFSDFFWDFAGMTDGSGSDTTYGNGPQTASGALETYRAEFDPDALFVPVEDDGGAGTAFAHWDEDLFARHLAEFSNSRNPELMTGFLDTADPYVSDTTIASFEDIGYTVVALDSTSPTLVPLPASGMMLLAGLAGIGVMAGRSRPAGAARQG